MENDEFLYSPQQMKALTILPYMTAPPSFFASGAIIYIILRDSRRKLKHVYHRLLLGMSIMDAMNSLNFAFSALVVPRGTPFVYGALGTPETCSASGFIFQLGFSVLLYNAFLCIYYVLVIRYEKRESFIAKRVEPFMHGFAIIHPLVVASMGVVAEGFNPMYVLAGWCYLAYSPYNCNASDEVDCVRGDNHRSLELFASFSPAVFAYSSIFVSMILVYCKVRGQEQRMINRSFVRELNRREFTKQTVRQAFLYIASTLITYIFPAVVTLAVNDLPTKNQRTFFFTLAVLTKVFMPLQGLWNFMIYLRPRYVALINRNPDRRRISLVRNIVAPDTEESKDPTSGASVAGHVGSDVEITFRSNEPVRGVHEASGDFVPELFCYFADDDSAAGGHDEDLNDYSTTHSVTSSGQAG